MRLVALAVSGHNTRAAHLTIPAFSLDHGQELQMNPVTSEKRTMQFFFVMTRCLPTTKPGSGCSTSWRNPHPASLRRCRRDRCLDRGLGLPVCGEIATASEPAISPRGHLSRITSVNQTSPKASSADLPSEGFETVPRSSPAETEHRTLKGIGSFARPLSLLEHDLRC